LPPDCDRQDQLRHRRPKIGEDVGGLGSDVPFPAGVAVDNSNNVYVAAFAIAPDSGLGIPGIDTSGQIWRLRF
jgi:hypothetical protein